MKSNKALIIVLILFLQGICTTCFAQLNIGVCGGGNPKPFELPPPRLDPEPSTIKTIISFWSFDPNEIVGLEGYNAPESEDTLRWVSATQSLAYTIYFENDAELAMAAASKVSITMPLHDKLNYATFGVGSFGFGNHIFTVEGSPSSYQTRIDLRDSMGIYLDVVAGLDIVHNEAFWIFQSIDPATGLPPTDIHLGFLPINDLLHSGEGFVTCTIKPKVGECVTGDTVSATASIVFDVNEAIPTNTWVNTIDAFAPTSTLTITPNAAGDMLTATFEGEDDEGGCGVKQYKLYYSVNGSAYQLYDVYPVGDTAQIPVETGMEYEFFTLAEDNVGNCEPMKTQPEYNIGTNFVILAVNVFPQEAGTVTGDGTYSVNETAQLSATAVEGYHFVNWMSQGVPVSTDNPYSAVVSQNQTYTAYFERNAYTLQTIADVGSSITVTDLNGNEVPSGSTVLHFDQLIVSTDTADCYAMESELLNGAAYVPGDTLTVTGNIALSTTTESLLTQTDTTATACDSFVWYGETLTETGDYTKTFTSTVGCDSVVTLHLTLKHSETAEYAETACDSYSWNDSVYTQSGDYVQTFTNADGCDSVVTLHLMLNHSETAEYAETACDSYTWNDSVYTQSGDYVQTFMNTEGCDSVVTLHLTVNHPVAELVEATACDSYTWNTTTYIQSGDYTQTFTAANGCDSVVTLHLTVNYSNTGDTTAVVCDSFNWYGTTYTSSGDYPNTLTNAAGCDSVVTLHLTVNHSVAELVEATACGSYLWNDLVYTQSGDYTQTLTTANGCDSVVTLHLTINHGTYTETTVDTCGTQYYWALADTTVTQSGVCYHYSANANTCIDTTVLILSLYQPVTTEISAQICEGEVYDQNGFNVSTAGDHQLNMQTIHGCDSTVILHLTMDGEVVTALNASICEGNSFVENGFEILTPEVGVHEYSDTIHRPGTCDSIVTLTLTVNAAASGDTTAVVCDNFNWYGTTYTTSGNYTQTFTAANGCDSLVTLHLTVNHSTTGDTTAVVCGSFVWYGTTCISSGNYMHTLTNAAGCDSIVTLHLTVNHSTTGDTTAVVCGSFVWYGTTCISSGNYTHTLTNANGCDSVVTLHLTVNHSNTGDTTAVVCGSFNWYGTTCISSGNYTRTLTNAAGCDSVVTLHLTVNHPNTGDTTAVACDSFNWFGTTYTSSGNYIHTLTNASGCDSVVTLHLTVNHSVAELVEVTACGSYLWNDSVYTQSGTYTQTLTTVNGCDSVVTLHLTVNHGTYTETTVDTCGTQYYWALADTTVTQSGTYYYYSTNTNTCADTAVLILSLYQPAATEISAQICAGEVYNQNGFNVSTAGDYQLNLQTIHGCDSTVILHLAVGGETVTYLTASICEGDNYNENGFAIMTPEVGTQVYFDTIVRPGACDSVVTLTLTVNAVTSGDTTAVVNSSFDWYGQHLTTTGDYTHTLTNAAGCDSVVTLHLTINYTNTGDTTAVACDSFDWYEHTNLTQSGDYVHVFTNAAGGDSVVTLHLTVNSSIFLELSETTCDAYSWNGIAYTQSGDYTQTFTAANGCDSVVTLHLTLIEMPVLQAITGESEICINQYATYHYDISDPNYQYRWFKDNVLWAENVPVLTLHEMSEGMVLVTMQVADEQSGCAADTSLSVQVVNRIAPDTTEIRRKGNTNILICQPVYSDYGQVHYRWGYTDLNTTAEVVMPGDRNYCLYDFGIDTLSYRYWVETYLNEAVGAGCENRSYYAYGYITTSTPDYGGNIVEAYLSNSRIVLYVSSLSPDDIKASLYDVNGKLLVSKGYGVSDQVSDMIPVSIAPGVYFLRVSIGGQLYSIKLLKI